ncbi:MAG: hypothetical protein C4534_01640 [Gaiellales bacterium]|nr:MAG: hypothetical protein C4534_01640 [Gaiellales bacterium]
MKTGWTRQLPHDPLPPLLAVDNEAINHFARRDLLGEKAGPASRLWELPAAQRLLRRQQPDGRWRYPTKGSARSPADYDQLETYRNLGILVEKHGLSKRHAAIRNAAAFLFSFQTEAGDFRGIYGSQYSPNYTAGIMELLIKAGYRDDPRVSRGFGWLLSIRQDDGGWAIPLRTRGADLGAILSGETLKPDRSKPCSHLVTGVALRAFAAHPRRRKSAAARKAAGLLAARFFRPDRYPDRRAPDFWERCAFPFWFTDAVSALDSLSLIGLPAAEPGIREALDWLRDRQGDDGLFRLRVQKGKDRDLPWWLSLAACRAFRRFYA